MIGSTRNRVRDVALQGDTAVFEIWGRLLRFTAKRFKEVAGGQRSANHRFASNPAIAP